eukprot:CAMPEP_0197046520 /NCGR_PEP_ID=MMETSP1384-20130603/22228_1 /TAXON_ID=29189 /ORGANISM="Ammonia sp." /LENGTH=193 /DNA_ID=CAMNT_0042478337 /DNA_START=488 /DNA_END=1069 /DNA_ORIENTATION=-
MHRRSASAQSIINQINAHREQQQQRQSESQSEAQPESETERESETEELSQDIEERVDKMYAEQDEEQAPHALKRRRRLKSRMNSLLESIVFHAEFESIVFNEENNTIESAQRCALDEADSDTSIHHVRWSSKQNRITNRSAIAANTIDEDAIITPKRPLPLTEPHITIVELQENGIAEQDEQNEQQIELVLPP